jgi:hypothetical protein
MLVAEQKRKENIAEYILYMYQVEDVIRAFNFDVDRIIADYVRPNMPDESFLQRYKEWYQGLIQQMTSQKLEKTGHLHELKDVMVELSYLHNTLLNITNDVNYKGLYERAIDIIEDFKNRSNLKDKNHIELAFHALYMKLLMRLKGQEISSETEEAFDAMRALLAYLSRAYLQMKNGSLDFTKN